MIQLNDALSNETSKQMLTTPEILDQLNALLALEYDLISAFDAVTKRLKVSAAKALTAEFIESHHSHVKALSDAIEQQDGEAGSAGDFKQVLAIGHVVLAGLFGDIRLLAAMQTNLELAVRWYLRANEKIFPGAIQLLVKQQLAQTRKHIVLLEKQIDVLENI